MGSVRSFPAIGIQKQKSDGWEILDWVSAWYWGGVYFAIFIVNHFFLNCTNCVPITASTVCEECGPCTALSLSWVEPHPCGTCGLWQPHPCALPLHHLKFRNSSYLHYKYQKVKVPEISLNFYICARKNKIFENEFRNFDLIHQSPKSRQEKK